MFKFDPISAKEIKEMTQKFYDRMKEKKIVRIETIDYDPAPEPFYNWLLRSEDFYDKINEDEFIDREYGRYTVFDEVSELIPQCLTRLSN